jgi:hypothetical protein
MAGEEAARLRHLITWHPEQMTQLPPSEASSQE